MANSLSVFGLSALNVVWGDSTGHTAVEGRSKLRIAQNGPAGVLLKRVASIQEAVTLGGLYLYDVADPKKWYFVCGNTLIDALRTKQLGKCPSGETDGDNRLQWDLIRRKRWYGSQKGYAGYNGGLVLSRVREYFGGDLFLRFGLRNFFESTATVGALGLVTGASEGRGFSQIDGALTHSYMASQVPMNVPFSRYLADIEASQLELVPADVRDYYARTFNEAVAAYVDKDAKPTIAITTVWEGRTEIAPVRWKPPKVGGGTTITALNVAGMPSYNYIKTGIRDPSTLQYPQDCVYEDRNVSNPTKTFNVDVWSAWNYNSEPAKGRDVTVGSYARLMTRIGHAASPLGSYQGIVHHGDNHPKDVLGAQNGVVSGLHVGYLRDFHVLGRSLVGGQRYATAQANHEHLADLVIETLDDQLGAAAQGTTGAEREESDVENEASEVLANEDPKVAPMYQRGTLSIHLARFSNLWDERAKALAKKEN